MVLVVLGELLEEVFFLLVLEGLFEVSVLIGQLVSEGSLEAVDEELGGFIVFQFLMLLLRGESLEGTVGDEFHEEADNEHGGGEGEALDVIVGGEFHAGHWGATELDEDHLDNDGQKSNHKEQWVVEEASENVQFVLKLSGVDRVEHLHENEDLEDQGVLVGKG